MAALNENVHHNRIYDNVDDGDDDDGDDNATSNDNLLSSSSVGSSSSSSKTMPVPAVLASTTGSPCASTSSTSTSSAIGIPPRLKYRLRSVYFWTEDFTQRAIQAYIQFMNLKVARCDWGLNPDIHSNSTAMNSMESILQLAPPVVIDQVWQQHVLHTQHYYEACMGLCGRIIHYDPQQYDATKNGFNYWAGWGTKPSKLGFTDHVQRARETTTEAARDICATPAELELWSFRAGPGEIDDHDSEKKPRARKRKASDEQQAEDEGDDEEDPYKTRPWTDTAAGNVAAVADRISRLPVAASLPSPPAPAPASTRPDPLTIFVRRFLHSPDRIQQLNHNYQQAQQQQQPHQYTDLYFKLLPTTKMQKVFSRFTVHYGLEPGAFVFFYGSKRVPLTSTPASLGMVDGEMLYATQCAAVEEEEEDI